jgi:hypothetical protein
MTEDENKVENNAAISAPCHHLQEEHALALLVPMILGEFWDSGYEDEEEGVYHLGSHPLGHTFSGCTRPHRPEYDLMDGLFEASFWAEAIGGPNSGAFKIEFDDVLCLIVGPSGYHVVTFKRGWWETAYLNDSVNMGIEPRTIAQFAAEGLVSPNSCNFENTVAARKDRAQRAAA